MRDTGRARSARRARIIGDVYAAWVAEKVANNTFQAALAGEVNGEENAEVAFLAADADAELYRRTTAALRAQDCDGGGPMKFWPAARHDNCSTLARIGPDAYRP